MYSIVTLCTPSHLSQLDQFISSWVSSSASRIYIYGGAHSSVDKVISLPFPDASSLDSIVDPAWRSVGFKPFIMDDALHRKIGDFVFLDSDCWMVEDVANVFDLDFSVGVTEDPPKPINAGVWFVKDTVQSELFAKEWIRQELECIRNDIGMTPGSYGYDEYALLAACMLFRKTTNVGGCYNVRPLSDPMFAVKGAKIVHFLGKFNERIPIKETIQAIQRAAVVSHEIQPGDSLLAVAGRGWKQVYESPLNATFRQKRPNPNLIQVGDKVFFSYVLKDPKWREALFIGQNPLKFDKNREKSAVIVTSSDQNYIHKAKQMFESVLDHADWHGSLQINVDDSVIDTSWFESCGIKVNRCKHYAFPHRLKYELFKSEYRQWDHIIYLDSDIQVRRPLTYLLHVNGIGAAIDTATSLLSYGLKETDDKHTLMYNTGVLSIPSMFIDDGMYDRLLQITAEYESQSIWLKDQTFVNVLLSDYFCPISQSFNLMLKWVDPRLANCSSVVHFAGGAQDIFMEDAGCSCLKYYPHCYLRYQCVAGDSLADLFGGLWRFVYDLDINMHLHNKGAERIDIGTEIFVPVLHSHCYSDKIKDLICDWILSPNEKCHCNSG